MIGGELILLVYLKVAYCLFKTNKGSSIKSLNGFDSYVKFEKYSNDPRD